MNLADALQLGASELVAFVGAGGKKTAMGQLVAEADTGGRRVGYTTTTHMPPPTDLPLVLAGTEELPAALDAETGSRRERTATAQPVAFASERVADPERADEKVRGFETGVVDEVFASERFDWLLVKADGARRREVKAPGREEPQMPRAATLVVPVTSVAAVDKPLDEATVHRPGRVAAITGREPGETLTAADLSAVLASPDGGRKRVPAGATVVPLVNKADTPAARETAVAVVAGALDRTDAFERGLVTSFERDEIEVVAG